MIFIEWVGYILLILYGIYCASFCACALFTLIKENKNAILRILPFRRNNEEVQHIFEIITQDTQLETIYE